MHWTEIDNDLMQGFRDGLVIPAHPLALDSNRAFDERRQRALTRYYIDAGAGGLAVGVHTTQFAIRDVGLYEPVLRLAMETARDWAERRLFMVAGVAGPTEQATAEARLAADLGYDAALLSLAALNDASEDALIAHCSAVAEVMPVIGFYLQRAVGGRPLTRDFWKRLAEIDNVIGIKIAPFDRYATLDVVRAVVEAKAEDRVTLYTGNDDQIVLDLVSKHPILRDGQVIEVPIKGGLLGHWSVWTRAAVETFERCRNARNSDCIPYDIIELNAQVTDCNAAVFDVANDFEGVIAGCHEILRRQGLLEGRWCLDPDEELGPGQSEELDRVHKEYPHLNDDEFVAQNLSRWLA
ncbi:dihydrodipicolinate synthase family protein [Nitratireductor aquimarinus]|uniref:dihydrodipicolinate synthase family protein n=1 Tax=Nitratireductor TaxID=245876 RepID=UPI0019D3BF4C|nr:MULTISPECIES: dihydrodipicolinate synthase family protein [Nitratireductor]MBN7776298.1 dihydrodipicolinate synthase family protein [Nitratireductor pacificus]MBN7779165.1 dihydrodipicolinate synthase family protein [Nitratireductor pacificus]MBN7787972.1 dihydrodipicolinate synthase family protein [Nitratireductor aquimarinus]MBY6098019.1 dihydrodipicolinate synthase family protein [Nitratireductor aquimarinus]MCA1262028.1 dihydrodipicolinate synthase family protein [Nitratireductor aquima